LKTVRKKVATSDIIDESFLEIMDDFISLVEVELFDATYE